jgi:hypothetical protein
MIYPTIMTLTLTFIFIPTIFFWLLLIQGILLFVLIPVRHFMSILGRIFYKS